MEKKTCQTVATGSDTVPLKRFNSNKKSKAPKKHRMREKETQKYPSQEGNKGLEMLQRVCADECERVSGMGSRWCSASDWSCARRCLAPGARESPTPLSSLSRWVASVAGNGTVSSSHSALRVRKQGSRRLVVRFHRRRWVPLGVTRSPANTYLLCLYTYAKQIVTHNQKHVIT